MRSLNFVSLGTMLQSIYLPETPIIAHLQTFV